MEKGGEERELPSVSGIPREEAGVQTVEADCRDKAESISEYHRANHQRSAGEEIVNQGEDEKKVEENEETKLSQWCRDIVQIAGTFAEMAEGHR